MTDPLPHPFEAEGQDPLIRLVYVSIAVKPLGDADLRAINVSSTRRNAAEGFTGFLIVQEPFFYGVMEGPGQQLIALMEIVATDRRHRCLRILQEEPIGCRRFVGWNLHRLPVIGGGLPGKAPRADFILDLSRRLGRL